MFQDNLNLLMGLNNRKQVSPFHSRRVLRNQMTSTMVHCNLVCNSTKNRMADYNLLLACSPGPDMDLNICSNH
jgi:hypothetical protein